MSNIEYRRLNTEHRRVRRSIFCLCRKASCGLLSVFFFLFTGCNNGSDRQMLLRKIEQLTKQNSDLAYEVRQTESENEQLKNQIRTLSGLPGDIKLSELNQIQAVNICRLTNLYDTNNDGTYDSLIVYIQPVDEYGDRIKVTGSVDVQLWDLNKPQNQSLIGQWQAGPDVLKKHWVELLIINYRLTFELTQQIENYSEPLTVKVKFTDYMSGQVFNEQKVISPKKS